MAVLQRLDGGLDDVAGCFEIRLADAEIDDVLALGCESRCPGEDGKGIFLTDTVKPRNSPQHFLVSHTIFNFCFVCGVA